MRNSTSLVLTVIVLTSSFCRFVSTLGTIKTGAGFLSILPIESVLTVVIFSFGTSVFASAAFDVGFGTGRFLILFFEVLFLATDSCFFAALSVLAVAGFGNGFFIMGFVMLFLAVLFLSAGGAGAGPTAILCFSLSISFSRFARNGSLLKSDS